MTNRRAFWATMGAYTALASGTFLLGKAASASFPLLTLCLFRFLVAALCFAVLARVQGLPLREPWRQDRARFLWAGFTGVLLSQVGFLAGLSLTLPSHAALLYGLSPVFVLVLACLRGQERPSARKLAGMALVLAGLGVVFQSRHAAGLPRHWLLGDAVVLLAVLAWASYTVVSRPLVLKYGALATTSVAVFTGTAMFAPLGLVSLLGFSGAGIPALAWAGLAYLGVMTSVTGYLLWVHALSLREPSRVAIAANGQAILTAFLGWALLHQPVSAPFAAGAALLIAGVVVTQY